jgi:transposase
MERRKFSAQFKQQIIRECNETGSPSIVARKHDLNANMVSRWARDFKKTGVVPGKSKGIPTHVTPSDFQQVVAERSELTSENEQLKKALAEQALENHILRDLLKKANPHLRTR